MHVYGNDAIGEPYPLFDFMEVPIIGKCKADLRQHFVRWSLDNVSLRRAGLISGRAWVFLAVDVTSVVMFPMETVHLQKHAAFSYVCAGHWQEDANDRNKGGRINQEKNEQQEAKTYQRDQVR